MGRGDVAVCDKDLMGSNIGLVKSGLKVGWLTRAHHISNGPPWKDYPADELADEVETALLIRDGHDDADWYEKKGGNGKSEQKTIPWKIDGVVFDNKNTDSKH